MRSGSPRRLSTLLNSAAASSRNSKEEFLMPLPRSGVILVLFLVGSTTVGRAQETTFPANDEIQLVLTQADRAMQQYKPLIDQEELQFGKGNAEAEAVAKDRNVVKAIEMAVQVLKKNPQGFNSAGGSALFEWLDDASRNAMVCSSSSVMQATTTLMNGEISKATELIHLGQSCLDASNMIYTVSENAGALYERYAKASQKLAADGAKVLQQCTDILKKMDAANKQRK